MKTTENVQIEEKPLEILTDDRVRLIPTEMIFPGELFARTEYDPDAFRYLCASIAAHGIVEPLIVTKYAYGYRIVSGDRRFYAAKHLKMELLPCLIRKTADKRLELTIKMSSKALSPFDCAEALSAAGGADAARELSMKRQEAEALLKLLDFSLKERIAAESAKLDTEVLFELLKIKSWAKRAKLLEAAAKERLSPREIRYLAKPKRRIRGSVGIGIIANSAKKLCAGFDDIGIPLEVVAEKDRVIIKKR